MKHRGRTHPGIITYGLYLYFNSRSYRLASKSLEPLKNRTNVTIWKWVQKYASFQDRFRVKKNMIKEIFVDETLIKINGQNWCLWIAYEPRINSCLSVHLSKERTIFICYQFFKQIREKYGKKPIYTDGAQWYIDACKWLRLKDIVYGTELKNIMERFIQQIKDRTECFDDHFPCVKDGCNMQHVWNWLRMFLLYLHMETDRIKFTNFLIKYS